MCESAGIGEDRGISRTPGQVEYASHAGYARAAPPCSSHCHSRNRRRHSRNRDSRNHSRRRRRTGSLVQAQMHRTRRGGEAQFGLPKESRPPRATVSGLDVEAPSGGGRFDGSTTNMQRSVAEVVGVFWLIRFCRGSSVVRGNLRLDPELGMPSLTQLQMPSLTRRHLGLESA